MATLRLSLESSVHFWLMNLRYAVAFAVVGIYLASSVPHCLGGTLDLCGQGVDAQQALAVGIATARSYGYEASVMFGEMRGPMSWETLARIDDLIGIKGNPQFRSAVARWNKDLSGRCLWSFYLGCEPAHATSQGGFAGCIDYPPQIWMLIDSKDGKVLRTCRQLRQSDRPDPCDD